MKKKYKRSSYTYNDIPMVKRSRTAFPIGYDIKTTANIGDIVPFDCIEVFSGDTWQMHDTLVSRSTSAYLRPVLDNAYVDVHHFFVPLRTIWEDYTKFITGSNGDGEPEDWAEEFNGLVPCIPKGTIIPPNTVGDALGLPTNVELGCDVSVLPFRAFAKVYNEWYRKESFVKSCYVQTGDFNNELPNNNEWSPSNYMGKLPKASKFADYFTTALPQPQKGDPVEIPISQDILPVTTSAKQVVDPQYPLRFFNTTLQSNIVLSGTTSLTPLFIGSGTFNDGETSERDAQLRYDRNITEQTAQNSNGVAPSNLIVDLTKAIMTNVNDMRLAFALQKIKERLARSGNRYSEYILATFGVQAPDASLQRSEFLGGKRSPLGYTQVAQTSQSSGEDTLASVGAYGLSMADGGFRKAFTENGYIISCLVVRYKHTYQQGIAPLWRRKERFDMFDPTFSHIGEQPIMATELYGKASEDRIFGYKPCWEELRRLPSKITKQMRSASAGGTEVNQDIYHYGDIYGATPTLSKDFIEENSAFMGRTLAVSPQEQDPFMFDIFRKGTAIRVLPMFGTPELIDHF